MPLKTTKFCKAGWLPALLITFFFLGCASFGKPRDFSPYAPTGIASVVSNYDINWVDETTLDSDSSTISDFVKKSLGIQGDQAKVRISKADILINDAEDMLRRVLTDAGIFRLAERDQLTTAASYLAAKNYRQPNTPELIIADGYKSLDYRNKVLASELSREAGVQSLIFVNFEFTKQLVSGIGKFGKIRARVVMSVYLLDPAGKIIYRREIETRSSDTTEVKDGAYSHEELMDLFKEPVGEACYRFVWDFTGVPKSR